MATSPSRTRAVIGGVFSLALVMAPLGLALNAAPASGAQAKTVRPFLALQPRVFPLPQVTFNVNSTGDGDVSPSTGTTCDDGSGHCTLRAGVDAANNLNQTVVINLPAGTYTVGSPLTPMNPAGTQILGAGNPTITSSAASTAIMVQQNAATNGAFLDLTTVTVANTNAGNNDGAGLAIEDGNDTVTMTGTTFSGNATTDNGGAIWNDGNLWATNFDVLVEHGRRRGCDLQRPGLRSPQRGYVQQQLDDRLRWRHRERQRSRRRRQFVVHVQQRHIQRFGERRRDLWGRQHRTH